MALLCDDLSDHVGMQTTEIIEGACTGERVGIRVVSVEQLGPKRRLLLDHRVRNVVVIDPLDSGPHSNREFLGREREIVDRDNGVLAAGRGHLGGHGRSHGEADAEVSESAE